ncbi:YidB family protein [Acinetobacter sp.]|uniref:YidB family protein n=1 Tax=Acinetobacter sp. TaxID=472 RepID=UPI00264A44ED|nr:YidB family protein [Acinetobacter sp.]MDN5510711.1 YidB family protein [Acinetobacter sp.]MDN5524489.1 YidB family protein [Acinetobacter sp.]
MTNLSNIVEILAKQALGGNQKQSQQGGLGDILGSVFGHMSGNNTQHNQQNNQQDQQNPNNQQRQQGGLGGLGGILGSVLGHLSGQQNQQQTQQRSNVGSSNTKTLLIAVLPLVLAWIQKQGGIQGALDKLKGQGLTSQVDDWVSTGPGENASVDQQQVQGLFDEQEVEQVAQETQVPTQDIYGAISKVLPQIIDSLTPQGEQTNKQEANADIQQVMNLVSGFLKR